MCDNVGCPYCKSRDVDYYVCMSDTKCKENFDDKDYFPCEHCKNYVNVGLTENYCDAIRCIEYDD